MKVRVTHAVRLHEGAQEQFLEAYEAVRALAEQGFAGHLSHQVGRGVDDDALWLITSEWASVEDYAAWEEHPAHREAIGPLRACFAEAQRPIRYEVVLEH